MESDSVYEKYYDEIVILLGTGLRISELCGLTDADLDFEGRTITVDHQLLKSKETPSALFNGVFTIVKRCLRK